MLTRFIGRVGIKLLAVVVPITLPAQGRVPDADWRTYNRTLTGDRFSRLTKDTRANVGELKEVCRCALPEVTSLQTGPIVIAGDRTRELSRELVH